MIRIGEFANFFNVSVKTIRLYEEKKLLKPCFVDNYSGYRYYDEESIKEMTKILVLKDLGLSLKEIKAFDISKIKDKIMEYEKKIAKLNNNLNTLKTLSLNKEELKNMKSFINDEKAIGKWSLLGVATTKKDALKRIFDKEDEYKINLLYLLPEGEKYWVLSWTKGFIFIKDMECPYEIEENKMYVGIADPNDSSYYKTAVYEKLNSNKYTKEDIRIKDNIKIPFIEDKTLKGCWQSIGVISTLDEFNPNEILWNGPLFLNKIIVSSDNDTVAIFNNENSENKTSKQIGYTKGYLINLCWEDTLSKYTYKKVANEEYIIVEWKSGDYIYGNMINCYYVLKRID